jgi:hypothetical protein
VGSKLRGVPKPSDDPVMREIYQALAYHETRMMLPGQAIEFSCQRCQAVWVGSNPKSLATQAWEHMRAKHPEAWREA